jgi:putative DNA primase/helicase
MSIQIVYKKPGSPDASTGTQSQEHNRIKLDATLLPHAEPLLTKWCGPIQISGQEIIMRNPLRVDENLGSFKFNCESGAWSDFAMEGFAGYGLTMLYAGIMRLPFEKAILTLTEISSNLSTAVTSDLPFVKLEKPTVVAINPDDVILPPDFHPDLGAPTKQWEYRDADNRLVFYVYRFDINGKKETRPLSWCPAKNAWVWQYPATPFSPYHFPDLLAKSAATVIVTEGEKAADAAARQFPDAVAITSACGSEQALRTDWASLKGRTVVISPDKDAPGKHYALAVAGVALAQGAISVKVIDVWQLPGWNSGDDLADHEVSPEFLGSAVEVLDLFEETELEPHVVKAAACLSIGDFDRSKKSLSILLGIGVRTFEGLVKEARTKEKSDTDNNAVGQLFEDDALEPWDEVVDGDALLVEIIALINRYIIVTPSQAVAVTCWIIFSYGFSRMRICPQLLINSPAKRCGKSTLLELIMYLVRRPLSAANISSAAVFRAIEAWNPTLLMDEADTYLNSKNNDQMTGILNSGHSRSSACVIRTHEIDGDHVPVRFSTFCPKVIAMIKTPADTIIDRSIVITLVRKLSSQRVDALAIDASEQLKDTRRRLIRWTADNLESTVFDVDAMPAMSNDRARQNWAVLAAFAQVLGPQAYGLLQTAAIELSDTSDIEENTEIDLLVDIQAHLRTIKQDQIQSGALVSALLKMKERPWGEINSGKALTENKLARLLKPFKISPKNFRDGAVTHRGYSVAALQVVFDRYLTKKIEEAT